MATLDTFWTFFFNHPPKTLHAVIGLAFHNCMYSKHICNPEKTQVSRVFDKKKRKNTLRVAEFPPVVFTAIKGERPAVV